MEMIKEFFREFFKAWGFPLVVMGIFVFFAIALYIIRSENSYNPYAKHLYCKHNPGSC